MKNEVDSAIKLLAERIIKEENIKADDALKLTQAALNLAHVNQFNKNVNQ